MNLWGQSATGLQSTIRRSSVQVSTEVLIGGYYDPDLGPELTDLQNPPESPRCC